MRFSRQGWAMVAAVAIVAMVSQVALAQREEGRRGRGGRDGGGFGGRRRVSRLLALEGSARRRSSSRTSKRTRSKRSTIRCGRTCRKAFEDGSGREKMQELNASATAKVNEVLDEGQQKRLMGILIQVAGAGRDIGSGRRQGTEHHRRSEEASSTRLARAIWRRCGRRSKALGIRMGRAKRCEPRSTSCARTPTRS